MNQKRKSITLQLESSGQWYKYKSNSNYSNSPFIKLSNISNHHPPIILTPPFIGFSRIFQPLFIPTPLPIIRYWRVGLSDNALQACIQIFCIVFRYIQLEVCRAWYNTQSSLIYAGVECRSLAQNGSLQITAGPFHPYLFWPSITIYFSCRHICLRSALAGTKYF